MSTLKSLIKDPYSAITFLFKGREYLIKKKICEATKKHRCEVNEYFEYIQKLDFIPKKSELGNIGQIRYPELLYTICRIIKPRVIIETGVGNGISSAYILKALEDNDAGKLISIDMPNYAEILVKQNKEYSHVTPRAIVPEGKEPGWIIPYQLRKRWTLKLGLTQNVLIPTLNEVGEIDIFLRDSEHTYNAMMFEFRNAWSYLRSGGLLLSDDISWNSAFPDFVKEVKRKYTHLFFSGIGSITK